MKFKNYEIYGAVMIPQGEGKAVNPLGDLLKRTDIPVKHFLPIVRTAKKIQEEAANIEQSRNSLILKYGTKGEDGNVTIKPGSDNWAAFVKEHTELMNMETEIIMEKMRIPESITISGDELGALEPFIDLIVGG